MGDDDAHEQDMMLLSRMLDEQYLTKQEHSMSAHYSICIADAEECLINAQHLADGNPTTCEDQISP